MSNMGTYYEGYEAENDGVIYGGLTEKWTYKEDALLLTNVTICQAVTFPIICLLCLCSYQGNLYEKALQPHTA